MKFSDLRGPSGVTTVKLRQEIFALGGRHLGDPLAGALLELKDPELTPERRSLLRAVVAHLSAGKSFSGAVPAAPERAPSPPATLGDGIYIVVLVAAVAWVMMLVRSMIG